MLACAVQHRDLLFCAILHIGGESIATTTVQQSYIERPTIAVGWENAVESDAANSR